MDNFDDSDGLPRELQQRTFLSFRSRIPIPPRSQCAAERVRTSTPLRAIESREFVCSWRGAQAAVAIVVVVSPSSSFKKTRTSRTSVRWVTPDYQSGAFSN